ncbi:MAG: hypothetical protein AB6733_14150 [Clostridiaceae bacterium]
MEYIIIFFVLLREHLILSLLSIFILIALSSIVVPKKFKKAALSFSVILLITHFINIFAGHFITNPLIEVFGEKGQGMVVDISDTSSTYNDETVRKYDVMIKPDSGETTSTYFLSSDFNIIHQKSFNEYYYPQTGIKFNLYYLKEYPKAFVIIANDDSEYCKWLQSIEDAKEISKLQNQLRMDPENTEIKARLDELLKKQKELTN